MKIEARAKERLADEYDAAQERGEARRPGNPQLAPNGDQLVTREDFGGKKQLAEARRIRDAERADPGAIERSIEARVMQGEAPTRAATFLP